MVGRWGSWYAVVEKRDGSDGDGDGDTGLRSSAGVVAAGYREI